ncbi:MAG: UMP kinase [Pseudomonadota bacterium]|nr:UMP kinase [Gammaproteobacteria bacterium]MBU1558635.1 UMP kinase [Gammaproteobacteria bacterium]MBU1926677.1 UMP kinase [Gammaproteobacteria bacterium]MBU2546520.1 UMP kinase [Gammaproteobacteria bacterium]
MNQAKPAYLRVLLKLSGEALLGGREFGIDPHSLSRIGEEIKELVDMGVEIGIVIGGGNFFRGKEIAKTGLDRVTSDQMGMLATIMNGLLLRDSLASINVNAQIMSSIEISGVVEIFNRNHALDYLNEGKVVIFVGGTGHPFFSTDSAASLRGIEINADIILKATKVDGVYSADPNKDPQAKKYERLSYHEFLMKHLDVMDLSAICLCQDNDMPLCVFNMYEPGILKKIILGETEGTIISN